MKIEVSQLISWNLDISIPKLNKYRENYKTITFMNIYEKYYKVLVNNITDLY